MKAKEIKVMTKHYLNALREFENACMYDKTRRDYFAARFTGVLETLELLDIDVQILSETNEVLVVTSITNYVWDMKVL